MDRSKWPAGPWDGEPDERKWLSAAGYPCLVLRHSSSGHLCGYVGMWPSHPWHGRLYDLDVSCHGGITYGSSDGSRGCDPSLWWLGFDCSHVDDLTPDMAATAHKGGIWGLHNEIYCNLQYVIAECQELARQIEEADDPLARAVRAANQEANHARHKST